MLFACAGRTAQADLVSAGHAEGYSVLQLAHCAGRIHIGLQVQAGGGCGGICCRAVRPCPHAVCLAAIHRLSAEGQGGGCSGLASPYGCCIPSHPATACSAVLHARADLSRHPRPPFRGLDGLWRVACGRVAMPVQNLPSEVALSHALDSSTFDWLWLPSEPKDAPTMDSM